MCCIVELCLFIYGVVGLISGRLPLTPTRVADAPWGHILGMIGIIPLPLGLLGGIAVVLDSVQRKIELDEHPMFGVLPFLEMGLTLAALVAMYAIAWPLSENLNDPAPGRLRRRGLLPKELKLALGIASALFGCCLFAGTMSTVAVVVWQKWPRSRPVRVGQVLPHREMSELALRIRLGRNDFPSCGQRTLGSVVPIRLVN